MKQLFFISFIFTTILSGLYGQEEKCFFFDENMKKFYFDCDDVRPVPSIKSNVDSVCTEMEKLFVQTLNKWRREHNLGGLTYDKEMERILSNPHNQWQLNNKCISHGEGTNVDGKSSISYSERLRNVGLSMVAECVAYNSTKDEDGVSRFFIQYQNSEPHWNALTDPKYQYISVSVVYDKEWDTFYSTVNLR